MSDCYCDFGQPEFFRQSQPFARITHRCVECDRTIAVGERYIYSTGKWDGQITSYRRCLHCEAVAEALREMPCYCDYYLGLWDTIADGWLDDLRSARTGDYFRLMRLIVAAKKAKYSCGEKK